MIDGKQVKNISNPTGTKALCEDGVYRNLSGGSVSTLTEIEIDFGINGVTSASFAIADALVGVSNKIICFGSPNPATDRLGNDWEVDEAFITAKASTAMVGIYVNSRFPMVGKRKIYYQILN
jgi:hypothetical protein